ncbi:MAG: sulfatase-like hydrolase/transferase, partial [Opitutaceae bacterium]
MKFLPPLLVSLFVFTLGSAAGTPAPNIVFIISDDHAWTDYGFMGHPKVETPNVDRLAARSALFPRGYVPTALCRPALATFASGLYAHQHKISGNDPAMLPDMAAKGGKKRDEPPEYIRLREKGVIGSEVRSAAVTWHGRPAIPFYTSRRGCIETRVARSD